MARVATLTQAGHLLKSQRTTAVAAISPTRMVCFEAHDAVGGITFTVVDLPSATAVVEDVVIPYTAPGAPGWGANGPGTAAALGDGRVLLVTPWHYCILSSLDDGWVFDAPWTLHGLPDSLGIGIADTGSRLVLVSVGADGLSRIEIGYNGVMLTGADFLMLGSFSAYFGTNPVYMNGVVWWFLSKDGSVGVARIAGGSAAWTGAGMSGSWGGVSQTAVYEDRAYVVADGFEEWDNSVLITVHEEAGSIRAAVEDFPNASTGTFQPSMGPPGEPEDLFFQGRGSRGGLLSMHGGSAALQGGELYGRWSLVSLPGWVVEILSNRINIYTYSARDDGPEPRPEPSWTLRAGARAARGYFS